MSEFNESQIITAEVQTVDTIRTRRENGRGNHVLPFELPDGIVVEAEIPKLPEAPTMLIPPSVTEINHGHDAKAQTRFEQAHLILDGLNALAQADYSTNIERTDEAELEARNDAEIDKKVIQESFEYELRALESQRDLRQQEADRDFANRLETIKQERVKEAKKLKNKHGAVEYMRDMAIEGLTNFKQFTEERDAVIVDINDLVTRHLQLTTDLVSKKNLLKEYEGNLSDCDKTQDALFDRDAALNRQTTAERRAFAQPLITELSTTWGYPIEAFDDENSALPQAVKDAVSKKKAEASSESLIAIADELIQIQQKIKRNGQLRAKHASLFAALTDEIADNENEIAGFQGKSQPLRDKLESMLYVRAQAFDINSWKVHYGTDRLSPLLSGDTSVAATKNVPPQFELVVNDILADQAELEARTGMKLPERSFPTFDDSDVLVALRTEPDENITVQELVQDEMLRDAERIQGLSDTLEAAQSINFVDRIGRTVMTSGIVMRFVDKPKADAISEPKNQIL